MEPEDNEPRGMSVGERLKTVAIGAASAAPCLPSLNKKKLLVLQPNAAIHPRRAGSILPDLLAPHESRATEASACNRLLDRPPDSTTQRASRSAGLRHA